VFDNVIIVHLAGGLGNQMFQYAFARANAKRLVGELALELSNKTLQIHNGFELNRIFNIQAKIATNEDMKSVLGIWRFGILRNLTRRLGLKVITSNLVKESYFQFSPEMLNIADNTYIDGYWQSEKYFADVVAQIREDYTFKLPMNYQNAELAKQLSQVNGVSLHVRRGDYAKSPKTNLVHGLCSLEYYQSAIQYIAERVGCPYFFVFSDDISWAKNNLKLDFPVQYIDFNSGLDSYNDMRLMSMCKHHIIANSSFSWWGAWLNPSSEKIVIAPKQWFANETDTKDLIPSNWIRL
jgi:hypothetical protein